MESPFSKHRDKVLGDYGTAFWLRRVVLSMWNGSGYPVGLSKLTGLDHEHAAAVFEMMAAYRENGENDPSFMDLAGKCKDRVDAEMAAVKREDALDHWRNEVHSALSGLGLDPGLLSDRSNWFEAEFDAGTAPYLAARKAKQLELS